MTKVIPQALVPRQPQRQEARRVSLLDQEQAPP